MLSSNGKRENKACWIEPTRSTISRAIVVDGQSWSSAGCIVDNGLIDAETERTETGGQVGATG